MKAVVHTHVRPHNSSVKTSDKANGCTYTTECTFFLLLYMNSQMQLAAKLGTRHPLVSMSWPTSRDNTVHKEIMVLFSRATKNELCFSWWFVSLPFIYTLISFSLSGKCICFTSIIFNLFKHVYFRHMTHGSWATTHNRNW